MPVEIEASLSVEELRKQETLNKAMLKEKDLKIKQLKEQVRKSNGKPSTIKE